MTDWDDRFLNLASFVSKWSKDPSTKVGAVLVGQDKREVALGYNGFPPGFDDSKLVNSSRRKRLRYTLHAERNVLDNAKFSCVNSTLYVTHPPCCDCAKSLVSKGISRVVWRKPNYGFYRRWRASIVHAITMMTEADIEWMEKD